MSLAKITLLGMTRWMQESDDDLFGSLNLPEGMDSDLLQDTILLHGAEFEVLYANPDVMKRMIGIWSAKWYHTFERWLRALNIDYDPLENYDRREEWTDVNSSQRANDASGANSRMNSHQDTEKSDAHSFNQNSATSKHGQTAEHKVSAYDASTYQPDSQDTLTNDNTDNSGASIMQSAGGKTGSQSDQSMETRHDSGTEREGKTGLHSGRTHGNIGVTTSQQMLQAELDVARFSLYEQASDLFLTELCIYTY